MQGTRASGHRSDRLNHPDPVDVHVGMRLRMRRAFLGLSQEALGAAMGLTFQQVQKYERGINRIGASRLFDLARALVVNVDYFYQGMGAEVARTPAGAGTASSRGPGFRPDLLARPETIDLIRAYYAISDASVRRRVHQLARALGERADVTPERDGPRPAQPDPRG